MSPAKNITYCHFNHKIDEKWEKKKKKKRSIHFNVQLEEKKLSIGRVTRNPNRLFNRAFKKCWILYFQSIGEEILCRRFQMRTAQGNRTK